MDALSKALTWSTFPPPLRADRPPIGAQAARGWRHGGYAAHGFCGPCDKGLPGLMLTWE